jgi:hypothetical protein
MLREFGVDGDVTCFDGLRMMSDGGVIGSSVFDERREGLFFFCYFYLFND